MLGQRRGRWANIKPALLQRISTCRTNHMRKQDASNTVIRDLCWASAMWIRRKTALL